MKGKRRNKAKEIWKSPWFGVVGVLVGVVGIVLALFFGLRPQPERELVYAVNPVRTAVVTAGQATELAVLYKGEPLDSVGVTAVQVAIWNAGKLSIWQKDILGDGEMVICTDPQVQILEASIRQRSREVTEFALFTTPESLASGRVPVSWRILEKDDGASIQLIYVGTEEVKLQVQGVIEGQGEAKCAELGVKIRTPQEQVSAQQGSRVFFGIMALVYGLIAAFAFVAAFTFMRHLPWRKLLLALAFSCLPVLVIGVWQYFFISTRLWPPFGF